MAVKDVAWVALSAVNSVSGRKEAGKVSPMVSLSDVDTVSGSNSGGKGSTQ